MKEAENLTRREKREQILKKHSEEKGTFRRGVTISNREWGRSERTQEHKLIARRRKLSVFFMGIAAISILMVVFLLQFVSRVSVTAKGVSNNNLEKYRSSIEEYFSANPSERFMPNLNRKALVLKVQNDNPEVSDISNINLNGITSYNFELSFRKPVASWNTEGKELFVDSEGISFSTNLFNKPTLAIVDDSGLAASNGKNVASSSFFSFVGKLVSAANNNGLEITKIRIPPASLRQVEVSVSGVKYYAKMSTSESAEGQIANFKTAINYFATHKISPSYVDLRIEGKGYYK